MAEYSQASRLPSILIIDDSPYICECLHDVLEAEDFRAIFAAGAIEGLAVLQDMEPNPDLIVTSWLMADMDALEFLRDARDVTSGYPIPVIFLADLATQVAAARFSLETIDRVHLISSFRLQDLLDTIQDALSAGKVGI